MEEKSANDQIISIVLDQEDVTWKTVLFELVQQNKLDPWDININLISKKFLETIQNMKETDLRVPAKMLLAAAVLLRIKSNRLVGQDMDALDQLFAAAEEEDEIYGLFDEDVDAKTKALEVPQLVPKLPQPRQRKVSIYDLVNALEKALETKKRRVYSQMPDSELIIPTPSKDITTIIKNIYANIKLHFSKTPNEHLTFSKLTPSNSRDDKVFTFLPLLHLSNQMHIELEQEKPFAEIYIQLASKSEVEKEVEPEQLVK